MKKIIIIFSILLWTNWLHAHDIKELSHPLKTWELKSEGKKLKGTFLLLKNGEVFIEDINHKVMKIPMNQLSADDWEYVLAKEKWINNINTSNKNKSAEEQINPYHIQFVLVCLLLLTFSWLIFNRIQHHKKNYLLPILIIGTGFTLFSFTSKLMKNLSKRQLASTLDSAFIPFKPQVHTYSDANYFYVESKGIPATHEMMAGISSQGWQQQVPIPQCYIANNAWPIPLNPVFSNNPIPVDSIHFTRGAIAIAANGVPIFNVHTNTGVDSYLDGQLDNYGGHCGRADDYHYHIAPLHLYNHTNFSLPIAYGLDGFPVYGNKEPDGNNMLSLDANHGHLYNESYHYHGTSTAPYMIARMAGQVTEDNTHQLIPQPAAKPVRPSLTPLRGALITSCISNGNNNGYKLTYVKNGITDSIVYSWTNGGVYTFKYYHNGILDSTRNFNGFIPCTVPISTGIETPISEDKNILVYPQPNSGTFHLSFIGDFNERYINEIQVYQLNGEIIYNSKEINPEINLRNPAKGIYLLQIDYAGKKITKKIIIQ